MNYKLAGNIFSVIVLAGLVMLSPLTVGKSDAKGKNNDESSRSLEAEVKEALREHEDVKIEVVGEDVILKGYVSTQDEKTKLDSQIRKVPGVKSVRDEVKIGQSKMDAIEDSVEDSAITTKVKAKILVTKGLESFDIHVKTEQGVVTLSGKVEKADEIALAEKVARETKGVKGVVNSLSVQSK